ncbi:MAG TPA: metal-dependent hydrolase, partial [Polyangia bacterium]|nr:metal-dependent hydrolase [Polyangia bacterium]
AVAQRPYRRFRSRDQWVFLAGALLPDLIDKPLYYGAAWWTGRQGDAIGLISGTHTFGHTLLFLLLLTGAAVISRASTARALALGVATHFLLDVVGLSMDHQMILWPLYGWRFPLYPFSGLRQHLGTVLRPVTLAGELLGAAYLWWDHRRSRRAKTT